MCKSTDFWDYVQDATADTLTSRGMLGAPFLAHCAPFIYLIISLINQKGAQGAGLFLVFFGVVSDNIKSMAYSY